MPRASSSRLLGATTALVAALFCATGAAHAGAIQGRVIVNGREKPGPVVIYMESVPGTFTPSGKRPELLHHNLAFFPRILPVLRGSTVDFPNTDPVFHSAFSLSPSNPFELGIYGQGREKFVQFNNAGAVEISCHIHPFMRATVLVLDNPYFAVTNQQGRYLIEDVPPGRYTIRTWGVDERPTAQSVSIDSRGPALLDITIAP